MRERRPRVDLIRLLLILAGVVAPMALATSQEIPRLQREILFRIEPGPVESALIQFSRQAEMQVVLAPDTAVDITVSAVHGRFAAGAALTALLKGTGLVYTTVGNTVTVKSSSAPEPHPMTFRER